MDVDVGQLIAGKYELVRLLGRGAMGEVWLARHNSLGGEFAIKLVQPHDDVEAETAAGRFQLEAQIAAKLSRRTRHIVSVSDHGEENGLAYLVMELLEGEALDAKTSRASPLPLAEVAAIVSQVARALSLAHEEGIVHRDLKPANIWLGKDEDGRLLVKLLDFGIARSKKPFPTRSPIATSKDLVLGTPSYMSPEQARGLPTLDYRCDLWALAVVAYEALTTSIPFEGESIEDIFLAICTFRVVPVLERRPDLPPAIEALFARAFAPILDDRFGSAVELSDAFAALVSPDEPEASLGTPRAPISARRLEPARVGSDPNHAPALADSAPFRAERSSPELDHLRGSSLDPIPVALGSQAIVPRRRSGKLVAIAGAIALLCIGTVVFLTFRGTKNAAARQPTDTSIGVPSAVPTAPEGVGSPVTALPTDVAVPAPPTTSKPASSAQLKPKPSSIRSAPNAHPVVPATMVSTAPPPSAPKPAKSVNKGDVF